MRPKPATTRRHAQGFSITELLVSISLVILIIGVTYPFIAVINRGSRVEAGLNIVGMSADVARQWVEAVAWANDGSTLPPTREKYSGTAAIYCPTGEIRIVVNDRNAQATAGTPVYLEDRGDNINGYKDLAQVDFIRIPDGVGIAGIERFGNGNADVRFIAPPFAIAFNELGQLSYGDNNGYIYYDANASSPPRYNTGSTRPAGYNPSEWDGTESSPNYNNTKLKQDLPFEAIECVPGVVVFSLDAFQEAGFDFDGGGRVTLGSAEGQWLKDNGQTVFFSPHTGVVLRDEQE